MCCLPFSTWLDAEHGTLKQLLVNLEGILFHLTFKSSASTALSQKHVSLISDLGHVVSLLIASASDCPFPPNPILGTGDHVKRKDVTVCLFSVCNNDIQYSVSSVHMAKHVANKS